MHFLVAQWSAVKKTSFAMVLFFVRTKESLDATVNRLLFKTAL